MSENLPSVKPDLEIRLPSFFGEVNLQQIRYAAAEDLLIVDSTVIRRQANGLFCLNDLHEALAAGEENLAPGRFLRLQSTKDAVARLELIYGPGILETVTHGVDRGSYAHEELAQDYAGWLNPIYKDKLRAIARQATVAQTAAMQERVERIEASLGQEIARRIQTEGQLHTLEEEVKSLTIDLEFSGNVIEDERRKAEKARKMLAMHRSPDLAKRRNAVAESNKELLVENKRLCENSYKALTLSGLVDSGLGSIRRQIPKEDAKLHKELAEIQSRNAKIIELLDDES